MKKHLATIVGILLALGVAFGVFAWDSSRRSESSQHRAFALHSRCYEEQRAATGATVSQAFPECDRLLADLRAGESGRMTSAAMTGAGAGAGFALLFFGGLWFLRRRRAEAAAGA
jgi:MYXO-CTERM domain-containing protein